MSQRHKADKPIFIGTDFSTGPDQSAIAIRHGARVVLVAASGGTGARVETDWINALHAGRKAEREALAMAFEAIARAHGAEIERRESPPNPGYCGAGIDLRFSLNGVGAMVDIDNLHGGDHVLVCWHNTEYPSRNFTARFCACVGESGNHRPHHKATSCPSDWYSLAMMLDAGLYLAARGEAFEPDA